MPVATRIRATLTQGVTEVRMRMTHPMHNGRGRDADDQLIPPHFIRSVIVRHRDRVVLDAQFGTSVSRNPYLAFSFEGGAEGDPVSVDWEDNLGQTRSDSVLIES